MRNTVYRQTIERIVRDWKNLMDEGRPYVLELKRWYKPRTTGKKSQCNHINGHVRQISMMTGNDYYTVKHIMKKGAFSMGYPFDTDPNDGEEIPWSEARIDTNQAAILIKSIHQFADENGFKLIEGDW